MYLDESRSRGICDLSHGTNRQWNGETGPSACGIWCVPQVTLHHWGHSLERSTVDYVKDAPLFLTIQVSPTGSRMRAGNTDPRINDRLQDALKKLMMERTPLYAKQKMMVVYNALIEAKRRMVVGGTQVSDIVVALLPTECSFISPGGILGISQRPFLQMWTIAVGGNLGKCVDKVMSAFCL